MSVSFFPHHGTGCWSHRTRASRKITRTNDSRNHVYLRVLTTLWVEKYRKILLQQSRRMCVVPHARFSRHEVPAGDHQTHVFRLAYAPFFLSLSCDALPLCCTSSVRHPFLKDCVSAAQHELDTIYFCRRLQLRRQGRLPLSPRRGRKCCRNRVRGR